VVRVNDEPGEARRALGELCRLYWYPLYAFVRRQGRSAHDAQDLTQEFFRQLIEKDWLASVERSRGRFRSFLLVAIKHFLANQWDYAHAQKRGGTAEIIPLDALTAEQRYALEPADSVTPEKLFERRWALELLAQSLQKLRAEFEESGRGKVFEELKPTLTGDSAASHAEIAQRLHASESAVKAAAHRLRQRYRELIRAEIAETVDDPAEIDSELECLFTALGS
jgi:RNA polymerase sigma-70 factor (ECF subfamily)